MTSPGSRTRSDRRAGGNAAGSSSSARGLLRSTSPCGVVSRNAVGSPWNSRPKDGTVTRVRDSLTRLPDLTTTTTRSKKQLQDQPLAITQVNASDWYGTRAVALDEAVQTLLDAGYETWAVGCFGCHAIGCATCHFRSFYIDLRVNRLHLIVSHRDGGRVE